MDVDRFDPIPLYQQVARAIRDRIKSGDLKPRDRIPSESELVAEHGIARETARRGIALLRSEGWVVTLPQRGTFVADEPGTPPAAR
ncbi:winged helix-turn-helix domain-containing protein [Nocardiopsis sp. CNT312]|uniref:winged helix-turn-helix domain-containing protein n=1 Tax=Nocardiopsis sp. CNT312 TaxID=1137268 RepID=UPI000490AE0E|nr:winged helix-turn-helix domain-containing protein [Nocardiopsis sp. CNT312]